MKLYIYFIILLSFGLAQDVHIWVSSIQDNYLELSIKSTQNIYGFDFKIKSSSEESPIINYVEEIFTNGYDSEMLYTIETGDGIVGENNFNCFTDGENRFIGLSLSNYFLPATDSTMMLTIPFLFELDNSFLIESMILSKYPPVCDFVINN